MNVARQHVGSGASSEILNLGAQRQAKHGEQAGAVALLIINDTNDYFVMTDDGSGRSVAIHAFLISWSDGDSIKRHLQCTPPGGKAREGGPAVDAEFCSKGGVTVEYGLGFNTRRMNDML